MINPESILNADVPRVFKFLDTVACRVSQSVSW